MMGTDNDDGAPGVVAPTIVSCVAYVNSSAGFTFQTVANHPSTFEDLPLAPSVRVRPYVPVAFDETPPTRAIAVGGEIDTEAIREPVDRVERPKAGRRRYWQLSSG